MIPRLIQVQKMRAINVQTLNLAIYPLLYRSGFCLKIKPVTTKGYRLF